MKQAIFIHLLLSSLIFQFTISCARAEIPEGRRSAKSCAICHYRWIDTFFIDGKGSDLVEYQAEKVVAKPEMCFSCHDGSVLDSRERVFNDYGHKTDKPPPVDIKIPEIFPLDEAGKVQCATCHTAHGVPWDPANETIFMRVSNKDSAMCRMCHPNAGGGIEAGNHTMGVTKQEIPGELMGLGGVEGGKRNQIICETCHTAHGSPYEGFLIKTAKDCGLCLECHSDKNIFAPDGKKKPFHVINVTPVKARIPDVLINEGAKLGYKGTIICQTCHKVHNNKPGKQLLLIMKNEKPALCLTCHSDKKHLTDTKHNLIHSAPHEKNLQGKSAVEGGVCSACHLPHKAARKLYGTGDFTTQLCLSCHSKGNVAEQSCLIGYSHPSNIGPFKKTDADITFSAAGFQREKPRLPLFNKFGIEDEDGKLTCLTCHDPHRWRPDSTKGEIRKDVKGNRTTSFLRKQSPEMCAECHNDKSVVANSKHDLEKVAPHTKNILNQTPSESGLCGGCHLVHGGQEHFLWARELTFRSDSIVQDLCIGCHNENGMAKESVVKEYSHAVNVSPFEKGIKTTLPLFDDKDKIAKVGLMRCHTCHDAHRYDPRKAVAGISPDVAGNVKDAFLRLECLPSPRLCEDCHPDQAYVEKTDHDLSVTAPASKNIIGQAPSESGLCGTCHVVHSSKNRVRLWAQGFGVGENIMEMMCNSCHSENGSANNKIPQVASHPERVHINNTGRNIKGRVNYFPLFDSTSGELTTRGNISCPSCHNVHQWDPRFRIKGKGVNVEGNATNSFLRARSHSLLCKDCHGPDALLKILNFHDPTHRKN